MRRSVCSYILLSFSVSIFVLPLVLPCIVLLHSFFPFIDCHVDVLQPTFFDTSQSTFQAVHLSFCLFRCPSLFLYVLLSVGLVAKSVPGRGRLLNTLIRPRDRREVET